MGVVVDWRDVKDLVFPSVTIGTFTGIGALRQFFSVIITRSTEGGYDLEDTLVCISRLCGEIFL